MPTITAWQHSFLVELFSTLFIFRGKFNFENFSRYSDLNEATFRERFSKFFDFLEFNRLLIETTATENSIIAFDPCYLPKSGKKTAGIGRFWSGCAGAAKHGLEICGFASIGLNSKTALHLIAVQTIKKDKIKSLLDLYASMVEDHAKELLKVSNIFVADAYFSKFKFTEVVTSLGFTFISKLAKNAKLKYIYLGEKTGKRGRPKMYDGTVDKFKLDLNPKVFSIFYEDKKEQVTAYQGIVYAYALKRKVKCIIVHHKDKKGKTLVKTFFSTDTTMEGSEILKCYKLRFQIEFLYRDAKQHMGLSNCQARSKQKMHTHINASLTAVSLAKVAHHLTIPKEKRGPFSLYSIKALYFNEKYIFRILATFHKSTKVDINSKEYLELKQYGCIAA